MDDSRIRQIIREEIQAQNSKSRFNLGGVQRHTHNGVDSPKVNRGDALPGLSTTGAVTFSEVKEYKFNVNFAPTNIRLYGIASNLSAGIRAIVVGEAALGSNLYFQPLSTSAVTIGGTPGIVQSYAQLMYTNAVLSGSQPAGYTLTGGVAHATTDDQHIFNVTDGSTIFARATVKNYGQNFFTIEVNTLVSGWTINASYFVT